tara:strand:- start:263 stop:1552 length:1290 start_codon:yes stop_codon:yes gene_type:complete
MIKKKLKPIINILLFFVLSYSPNLFGESKETLRLMDLFQEVFERTHEEYVEEVSEQDLIEKALNGMLSALDPHSGYMNEKTFQEMQIDTSGKFGGLGIQITLEEGIIKVISPIDDTPAYEAGVIAGDLITAIDGIPVLGMTLNESVDLMRGKPGSKITITIAREGSEIFDLDIIRDIIKIQSVKHEIFDNNIGYLRITSFTEQTKKGLGKAIKEIQKKLKNNEIGYILDLRSNPGGLLTQAIAVSDIFLENGEIVSTRERGEKNIRSYKAKKGDMINNKALIVLINNGSASASEIVAGALQDHDRAIILGTKSFGKGSVQSIIPLFDYNRDKQGAIRLTTARYYTPSGNSIQAKGIEPDIVIEQGKFEKSKMYTYSESDLRGSLNNENELNNNESKKEIEDQFEEDYQLSRAVDLIKALSILNNNIVVN